jgi:hypothetical protein
MHQSEKSERNEFAPTVLRGLLSLGPVDRRQEDLALELGLSLWMRRCGTNLASSRFEAMDAREALLEVAGMDPEIEPIPLVGRSPEADIVNLAGYLSQLIQRAAASCGRDSEVVVELAIETLELTRTSEVNLAREAG